MVVIDIEADYARRGLRFRKETKGTLLGAAAHIAATARLHMHCLFMTDPKKPEPPSSGDRRWNDKQGTPKDPELAKTVERASGRYSASEQSEEKRKKDKR